MKFLSDIDAEENITVTGNINMSDNQAINFGGQTMFLHTGSITRIGDSSSSSVLSITGGNSTFTGSVTVASGDITLQSTGRIRGVDTVSATTDAANKAYVDNAIAGIDVGVQGVTAGTGLSGGGNFGNVTLNLDLGELATGGTLIATDYLIAENGGVDNRQLISSIPLSIFNNNAGWTSNTGDITGVTAGTGLSGGGTSGTVTLTNSGVTSLNSNTGAVTLSAGANISLINIGNTITISASGGGGGTISGTIANQEIAVGTSSDTIGGEAYFKWTPQSGLQLGNNSQGGGANIITIDRPSGLPGKFIIEQGSTTEFSIVTGGDTTMSTNTNDLILTDDTTAKVGVGNTSPTEKLDVTGRIKASEGVQVGNETSTTAASGLVGTLRYRLVNGSATAGTNYSFVDMCMQTDTTGGLTSYEWVNIVTNRW